MMHYQPVETSVCTVRCWYIWHISVFIRICGCLFKYHRALDLEQTNVKTYDQ